MVSVIDSQLVGVNSLVPFCLSRCRIPKKDNQLSVIYEFVANNRKPKLSENHCIRSKAIRHLLLKYDRLSLIQGVLHRRTFQDDDELQ